MTTRARFRSYFARPRWHVILVFVLGLLAVGTYGALSIERPLPDPSWSLLWGRKSYRHGWPWVYLQRHTELDETVFAHFFRVDEFSPSILLANLGITVVIAACPALLWHLHTASGRKPWQFSMKEMLCAGLFFTLLLSFWRVYHVQYQRERQVLTEFAGVGWAVDRQNVPLLPHWLLRPLQDSSVPVPRCFWRAGWIAWDAQGRGERRSTLDRTRWNNVDEMLQEMGPKLAVLTHCEYVEVRDSELTDAGVEALCANLRGCTEAHLEGSQDFTDAGVLSLVTRWRDLDLLSLAGEGISDKGIDHLRHLRNLEALGLINTSISDKGVAHLSALPKLRWLQLIGAEGISRDAAREIPALPHLDTLEVPGSWLDDPSFVRAVEEQGISLLF